MRIPDWGVFYDFHTMRECPEVGTRLDIPDFVRQLKKHRIDFVTFAARCNQGFAYYDTALGIRHPGLGGRDLFGELVCVCRRAGLAVNGYINLGISMAEYERHPDWRVVAPPDSPPMMLMCYNSGYGEHAAAMVREIACRYHITGIFLDCLFAPPCGCPACRKAGDGPQASRRRFIARISEVIRECNPEAMIFFNSMPVADQRESGNYLELESLPNGGWSYETLPLFARYLRNFGRPVFGMSGRFHRSWGDFGGIRSAAALEYDCAGALANGLRVTVGDHMHPRGDFNPAALRLIGRVFAKLQRHRKFFRNATPVTEISLIVPGRGLKENSPRNMESAYGACRMLLELGMQFDVYTADMEIPERHRLLILADDVPVDDHLAGIIRRILKKRGGVISTWRSGLRPGQTEFAMPEFGAVFRGDSPHDPLFVNSSVQDFPEMPVALYERAVSLAPAPGAEIIASAVAPLFNHLKSAERPYEYIPPDRATGEAVIFRHGQVICCSPRLCGDYFLYAQLPMRALFKAAVKRLLPQPLINAPALPTWVRISVTGQPGRRLIHLLSYIPERRGREHDIIEQAVPMIDAPVGFRLDGAEPARVFLSPDAGKPLPFTVKNGYIHTVIPKIDGYALLVIELKPSKRGKIKT